MTELLIIAFGLTILYVVSTSRLEAYLQVLTLQGLLLALIIILDNYGRINSYEMLLHLFETLIVKAWMIPWLLGRVIKSTKTFREIEPFISNLKSLAFISVLFFASLLLSYKSFDIAVVINPLYFCISLSTVISGLFIIMTRKKIITHVMGFLIMENGIFLMTLALSKKIPLIINLGIMLDVFIGVFILVMFISKIKTTFDALHIDSLSELRD
ncbi:MAG: hypothetical protein ABIH39_08440 [Candidatus Margulisiibacteriota bacterium]